MLGATRHSRCLRGPCVDRLDRNTRMTGFFYLLLTLAAPFRLIVIPDRLFVSGNAAATVANLVAHDILFRLGIVSDLFVAAISLLLTVALYRLFRDVNRTAALAMLMFGLMDTPLYLINVVNDVAALSVAHGSALLGAFSGAQREGLAMFFLHLHGQMIVCSETFWGLWLFPLAWLVWHCRFLPRFLVVWLVINGVAYVALSLTGLIWRSQEHFVSMLAFPCQLGEVAFMLWMLLIGARPRRALTVPETRTENRP